MIALGGETKRAHHSARLAVRVHDICALSTHERSEVRSIFYPKRVSQKRATDSQRGKEVKFFTFFLFFFVDGFYNFYTNSEWI